MATAAKAINKRDAVKQFTYKWEGKDRSGKTVSGTMKAEGEAMVSAQLRRQGIANAKVSRQRGGSGGIS